MEIRKQESFHAYRGTSREWGQKWEKDKELKYSSGDDEYFGHGCYFFENDYEEAKFWANGVRHIDSGNIAVIYAYIESKNVYDLIDRQTYNEYIKLVETISKRYDDQKEKPDINRPYDCNIINMIVDKMKFDMVRGQYNPNHKLGIRLNENGATRMKKTHIQLCVVNKNIIKNSEVEYI